MRIKRNFIHQWKAVVYSSIGLGAYVSYFHADWAEYVKNHFMEFHAWQLDYDDFKRREQWRWNNQLKMWDPYDKSGWNESMGYLSNSVADKIVFGEKRWEEPPSYNQTANDFIQLAESSGVDPAKPLLNSIKKVVDYYYPIDLDENPNETKQVLEPRIQWTHTTDMDSVVEEDEKKPQPNSLGRYLWSIPGFQEFFEDARDKAREAEEEIVTTKNRNDRLIWYEKMDEITKRWAQELNDYAPLLAYRWDRKLKLANFLMQERSEQEQREFVDLLNKPGAIKQLFKQAGIITPTNNDFQTN